MAIGTAANTGPAAAVVVPMTDIVLMPGPIPFDGIGGTVKEN